MCYSIPGKIEELNGKTAVIDYFGEKKKAVNEFFEVSPGDYVYVQGGFIIEKLTESQALEVLAEWKSMFFLLQEKDKTLSGFDPTLENRTSRTISIFSKALKGIYPAKEDMVYLLGLTERAEIEELYRAANYIRQKHHKNACCVHGIIEISNTCQRDCHYCGISTWNKTVKRYRMSKQEILEAAEEAIVKYGFRALVLQSAEDKSCSVKDLAWVIKEIMRRHGALVFISFGEIGEEALEELYAAGARGLLLRFETSDPALFAKIHPGSTLDARIKEIKAAYDMGYLIVTGAMVGIPGQTPGTIADDIILTRELNAEMFSFGPFIPHPETPLGGAKAPDEDQFLKVLAVSRIAAQPEAKVLVTTAFETLSPTAREKGLMAGASTVMLNATPMKYRELYSIYPNRAHEKETVEAQIEETISLLKDLGRAPTDLGMGTAGN
jgi:biotin synthase